MLCLSFYMHIATVSTVKLQISHQHLIILNLIWLYFAFASFLGIGGYWKVAKKCRYSYSDSQWPSAGYCWWANTPSGCFPSCWWCSSPRGARNFWHNHSEFFYLKCWTLFPDVGYGPFCLEFCHKIIWIGKTFEVCIFFTFSLGFITHSIRILCFLTDEAKCSRLS